MRVKKQSKIADILIAIACATIFPLIYFLGRLTIYLISK